jgi:hypothetical protein
LLAIDKLLPFTSSQVFAVQPSQEGGPLTPNDFNVRPTQNPGAKRHVPVRAPGSPLYVEDGGRNIRELAFNFVDNRYKSPDMFKLADHLVEFESIKAIDFQRRPNPFLWAWREDGRAFAFAYNREEEVTGWARFETGENTDSDGFVQSLCIIPRVVTKHDWVWLAVDREINGTIETYIEHLDAQVDQCREWREAMTDSAIFTTADENFVISGLDHLEGKVVWIIGDGMLFNAIEYPNGDVLSTATVQNGQVQVSPQIAGITRYEVGLPYESDALTLEPIIPNELGGPLMARGWEVAGARVRRTMGLRLNEYRIPFRKPEDPMDAPTPLKKGKVNISVKECDSQGRIRIRQDLPFPCEVLNIMGRVAIGDEPLTDIFPEETPKFFVDCQEVIPPPPSCPADTVPTGPQSLDLVHCYQYNTGIPPGTLGGNSAGQVNYFRGLGDQREFVATVGNASGFGINYPPASNQWQLLHMLGDTITAVTPVSAGIYSFSFAPQAAQGGTSGHSDEMSYVLFVLGSITPLAFGTDGAAMAYFSYANNTLTWLKYPFGASVYPGWAKKGTRFWAAPFSSSVSIGYIARWDMLSGLVQTMETLTSRGMGNDPGWLRSYAASDNHLYVLFNDGTTDSKIFQLNLDTLAVTNSWTLSALGNTAWGMDVAGNDLLYIVADGWSFNYFIPSTGSLVHIDDVAPACNGIPSSSNPAGQPSFHYAAGHFALTHGGHAFGFVDTAIIGPLLCPGTNVVIGSV